MPAPIKTTFDFASLQRALESWDVDALLALYDDEVEFKQIDKETPPSSPRIVRGKRALAAMFADWAGRGLKTRVGDASSARTRSPSPSPAGTRLASLSMSTR